MEQTNTGNAFEWAKFLAKHRASGIERFWRMVKAAPIPACRSEPGWWIMEWRVGAVHVEAEGRGDAAEWFTLDRETNARDGGKGTYAEVAKKIRELLALDGVVLAPNRRTITATGHRPPRLGGYGDDVRSALLVLARRALEGRGAGLVISGMALGWDQAVAAAAVDLSIPFIAALPFEEMGDRWPEESQRRRDHLLGLAAKVEVVGGNGPFEQRFIFRDHWMVERAALDGGIVLALWDGSTEGGTFATVKHARKMSVEMVNVWDDWSKP